MMHTVEIEVRSYELDAYNHVNNAVYLNYLEYSRMEFLKASGFDYKNFTADGYMLYVTGINIKYKYSAKLSDKLFIESESIKLGKVSGAFKQVIKNSEGTVYAEAEVGWACVNENGRPSKIPKKYLVQSLFPCKDC